MVKKIKQPRLVEWGGNQGFTMIELLVVSVIMVIVAGATVNILLTTLSGSTKDAVIRRVKLNGDTALVQLENKIRGAAKLVDNGSGSGQICAVGMDSLGLEYADGTVEEIYLDGTRLASSLGHLTGDEVVVTSLRFDCEQDSSGKPVYVELSFSASRGQSGVDRNEEVFAQQFKTGVSLRRF